MANWEKKYPQIAKKYKDIRVSGHILDGLFGDNGGFCRRLFNDLVLRSGLVPQL